LIDRAQNQTRRWSFVNVGVKFPIITKVYLGYIIIVHTVCMWQLFTKGRRAYTLTTPSLIGILYGIYRSHDFRLKFASTSTTMLTLRTA
jgi:hypothetical protein